MSIQSTSSNPASVLVITFVMSGSLFFNQWGPRILGISCPRAALSDAVNGDKCYVRNGFKGKRTGTIQMAASGQQKLRSNVQNIR